MARKNLPNDFRRKLLTKEDGKTVPQKGFYLVFVKGNGKSSRHKAIAWEYRTESKWCRTKRQAIEKLVSRPRLTVR